jgi:hypothetical protein
MTAQRQEIASDEAALIAGKLYVGTFRLYSGFGPAKA